MPFTNSPTNSTYDTQRVPLACSISLRTGATQTNIDPGMINVLPFKETDSMGKDEVWGETRYTLNTVTVANATGNIMRGMYVWEPSPGVVYNFTVVGQAVYSTTGTVWTQVNTLTNNKNTPVRFTEYIDASNTKKLILVDGYEGYVFTSNAAGTKITDANFPSPHVPFPIYLDGYLFLAKANTGDIYNSNLNDPMTWTSGSFFSAQMYPDDIQALIKINNYIAAVGTSSTEFFYDAGNSPGSPLAKLDGATLPFGTQFPNSIAANKNTIVMLSNSSDGETCFRMIEDLKYKNIENKFINGVMTPITQQSNDAYSYMRGYFLRQQGKLFYALCLNGITTDPTISSANAPTYCYSFDTEIWVELNYNTNQVFPIYFSSNSTTGSGLTSVAGSIGGRAFFGVWNAVRNYDTLDGGSTSVPVYEEIRTAPFNFGTMNRKFMSRLALGYSQATLTNSNSAIYVMFDDSDWTGMVSTTYQFAGTNTSYPDEFPFLTQLGSFRQRSFKLYSNSNTFRRWKFLEIDINKGQQ